MNEPKKAEVVASCLIFFADKLMLAKRLKNTKSKGFWETTSGKIENKETIVKGLQREILEESGLFVPHYELELIDCYFDSPFCDKLFVFKTYKPSEMDFWDVRNLEPTKRTKWQLFPKFEAKKLNLMPHLFENI